MTFCLYPGITAQIVLLLCVVMLRLFSAVFIFGQLWGKISGAAFHGATLNPVFVSFSIDYTLLLLRGGYVVRVRNGAQRCSSGQPQSLEGQIEIILSLNK